MSVSIDIEKFPKWSDILKEIERQLQNRTNASTATDPEADNVHKSGQARVERSSSMRQPDSTRRRRNAASTGTDPETDKVHRLASSSSMREAGSTRHYRLGRVRSHGEGAINEKIPLSRHASAPCYSSTFDANKILRDSRLTDAAKTLDNEKLALLYEDILKPPDVESLLHERRAQSFET